MFIDFLGHFHVTPRCPGGPAGIARAAGGAEWPALARLGHAEPAGAPGGAEGRPAAGEACGATGGAWGGRAARPCGEVSVGHALFHGQLLRRAMAQAVPRAAQGGLLHYMAYLSL